MKQSDNFFQWLESTRKTYKKTFYYQEEKSLIFCVTESRKSTNKNVYGWNPFVGVKSAKGVSLPKGMQEAIQSSKTIEQQEFVELLDFFTSDV